MPCAGFTPGVKPVSNSHLLSFIAMESVGGGVLGSGDAGYWGCHIESDHPSCVIDRFAPAAPDQGPGGLPEYRKAGHCKVVLLRVN